MTAIPAIFVPFKRVSVTSVFYPFTDNSTNRHRYLKTGEEMSDILAKHGNCRES